MSASITASLKERVEIFLMREKTTSYFEDVPRSEPYENAACIIRFIANLTSIKLPEKHKLVDGYHKLIRTVCKAFLIYWALKSFAIFVAQYRYDVGQKQLAKDEPSITNKSGRCELTESKDGGQSELEFLQFVGSPLIFLSGIASLIFGTSHIYPLTLVVITPYLFESNNCQFSFLDFIIDPQGETHKVENDLRRLTKQLVTYICDATKITSIKDESFQVGVTIRSKKSVKFHSSETRKAKHRSVLANVLLDNSSIKQVKPASYATKWHQNLVQYFVWSYRTFRSINLVVGTILLVSCFVGEFYLRSQLRYELVKCRQEHQMGADIRGALEEVAPLRSESLVKYEQSDGSFRSLIYLALSVEFKQMLISSRKATSTMLELFFSSHMIFVGLGINALLYSISILDKLYWLNQLNWQLDLCVDFTSNLKGEIMKEREVSQLFYKISLISYLNLRLFTRRNKSFQSNLNYLTSPLFVSFAETLCICYMVISNSKCRYISIVVFGVVFIVILTNLYILIAGAVFTETRKVYKNLARLIAYNIDILDAIKHPDAVVANCHIEEVGENVAILINLWLRQLMVRRELTENFAIYTFMAALTSDKIMTVNAYVLALALILPQAR